MRRKVKSPCRLLLYGTAMLRGVVSLLRFSMFHSVPVVRASAFQAALHYERMLLRRVPTLNCPGIHLMNALQSNDIEPKSHEITFTGQNNPKWDSTSQTAFIQQVLGFLECQDISYRRLTNDEVNNVLQSYSKRINTMEASRKDEWKSMLKNRTILFVGEDCQQSLESDINFRSVFLLHLCPTLQLSDVQNMYKQPPDEETNICQTVGSYAWLNACLTNAFLHYDKHPIYHDKSINTKQPRCDIPIVHLHQDVWSRSPAIVQSRLRSKVGRYSQRIYARKTTARRITKTEYLPFLEENHLWSATGAKYAYGLYCKPNKSELDTLGSNRKHEELVAVATFSSKRKVRRAGHDYHSYELLRFCTKLDTAIVGGLTKLISAFVKDVPRKKLDNHKCTDIGIDIITSIDRDFGSNTWPDFETMDVMNPVPMFVGEDKLRRHAVGAGLIPLDQYEGIGDDKDLTASELLRAGLPLRLVDDMNQQQMVVNNVISPWEVAARSGFHPVFDAGVERLMYTVERSSLERQNASKGTNESEPANLSLTELWEQSIPRFVTEHYSPNKGVEQLLRIIKEHRI